MLFYSRVMKSPLLKAARKRMVWTFFSSVQGQVVPGLCFLCISLISVKRRKSFPLQMHQLIKKELTGCSKYREISTEKEVSKSDEKQ
ncbi:MAG: hypothetical protein Q9N62_12690 [Ghiorsea sp.]|nr:hypothetical protein [Ghiorsea sp.]